MNHDFQLPLPTLEEGPLKLFTSPLHNHYSMNDYLKEIGQARIGWNRPDCI